MFSNQGPAQEDLRARGSRRNVSEGVGGPPFLRDGPMVPCGPPDPGPMGKPSVPCGEARSRHAPLAPRPRKPRGRPKDPILPPTRESRRPPWDRVFSRNTTDRAIARLAGYQTLLSRAKMPTVASCGPFACPPPSRQPGTPSVPAGARGTERRAPSVKRGLPLDRQGFTTTSVGAPK